MKEIIFNGLLKTMLCFIILGMADVSSTASAESIKKNTAEQVAKTFVQNFSSEEETGMWSQPLLIEEESKLYDMDGNVSAYAIEYTNKNQEDCGYVVVGANENYAPIIEYSQSGNFIHTNKKIYYLGEESLDYYIENKNGDLQGIVSSDNLIEKEKDETKSASENYKSEWNSISNFEVSHENKGKNLFSANPPKSGNELSNPYLYEKGWISIAPIDVTKYNLKYFTTSSFVGYNSHCAPTAGTNLLYYWYNRNKGKYSSMLYQNSWGRSFIQLYKYMNTSASSGTDEKNIATGMKKYLNKVGLKSSSVKWYPTFDFADVVYELDNGKGGNPFIFCLYDHYLYGDHAVLALGYMEFEYKKVQSATKSKYSRYLRIADGWSSSANRFVHVKVGHKASDRGMITVHPKK